MFKTARAFPVVEIVGLWGGNKRRWWETSLGGGNGPRGLEQAYDAGTGLGCGNRLRGGKRPMGWERA